MKHIKSFNITESTSDNRKNFFNENTLDFQEFIYDYFKKKFNIETLFMRFEIPTSTNRIRMYFLIATHEKHISEVRQYLEDNEDEVTKYFEEELSIENVYLKVAEAMGSTEVLRFHFKVPESYGRAKKSGLLGLTTESMITDKELYDIIEGQIINTMHKMECDIEDDNPYISDMMLYYDYWKSGEMWDDVDYIKTNYNLHPHAVLSIRDGERQEVLDTIFDILQNRIRDYMLQHTDEYEKWWEHYNKGFLGYQKLFDKVPNWIKRGGRAGLLSFKEFESYNELKESYLKPGHMYSYAHMVAGPPVPVCFIGNNGGKRPLLFLILKKIAPAISKFDEKFSFQFIEWSGWIESPEYLPTLNISLTDYITSNDIVFETLEAFNNPAFKSKSSEKSHQLIKQMEVELLNNPDIKTYKRSTTAGLLSFKEFVKNEMHIVNINVYDKNDLLLFDYTNEQNFAGKVGIINKVNLDRDDGLEIPRSYYVNYYIEGQKPLAAGQDLPATMFGKTIDYEDIKYYINPEDEDNIVEFCSKYPKNIDELFLFLTPEQKKEYNYLIRSHKSGLLNAKVKQ